MNSKTEENYLKNIFHLSQEGKSLARTSDLASKLKVSPASVSDMLKKMDEKTWITYEKSKGVRLTHFGMQIALQVIRKHRLWELYLVKHLGFMWDEVHDIAEQLEHVQSEALIQRIDQILKYPKFDPHGDPIPDAKGSMEKHQSLLLSKGLVGLSYRIVHVLDHSKVFLDYLNKKQLFINQHLTILSKEEVDQTTEILVRDSKLFVSQAISSNIFIEEIKK